MVGNKRGGTLATVETIRPVPQVDHDRLREDREYRSFIRRERSSAYWFAATKWGILGLVAGMIMGGVGMYYASMSTIDMAQDAISKGEIIADLRRERLETPPAPEPFPSGPPAAP